MHKWITWVPIPTDVIRNEDGEFSFKFRFLNIEGQVMAHFDPEYTGCGVCKKTLTEVFGEPCIE